MSNGNELKLSAAVLTCCPAPVVLLFALYSFERIPRRRKRIIGLLHQNTNCPIIETHLVRLYSLEMLTESNN